MDFKDGAESSKSSGGGGGSSSGSKNNKATERNKKGKLDTGANNNNEIDGTSTVNNAIKTVSANSAEEAKPIFRVSNPNVSPTLSKKGSPNEEEVNSSRKLSNSSKTKDKFKDRKRSIGPPPPPPAPTIDNVTDDPGDSEQSESLEQDGMSLIGDIGLPMETQSMEELQSNAAASKEAALLIEKSQGSLLKDKWRQISSEIRKWFDDPCRVYKLRGYHSEPNLSLPFYEKFDAKLDTFKQGAGKLTNVREKFVSCEDIIFPTGKEHPNLVRGILSEIKLRTYAIDEKMKDAWRELVELEKKRFSFLDELFAMGYVVDSLEVLSPPPKGEDGKPITQGEYFIEADEKHYRKKVDYGRVVFKTKHVYTGNFQDWYFHGPGRYSWQDGTVYQGEFCQGLMHGPGSIHWPDGCVYEGHFINGIRTGWGVYSSADGYTYAGEWLNGLPHGHGKMWYDPEDNDNDYYEGQWQQGLPEGAGTRQYSTGDRYVGNWSRGMRNGYGIMIWLQERQVYKGEWLDGVPHGLGKHLWYLERSATNNFPTRHVYQGNWVLGRREGIGKMIYPCGSIYEGRWKNGQRNGKGLFINPAGDILVGLFRAGSILGGSEVPLHAPTYDCDYSRLIEWLTAKFNLKPEENKFVMKDEDMLGELTKQYLPYIRKLYHRAGEYCQKYGNNGLYPAYLKKGRAGNKHSNLHNNSNPEDPHHRDYSKLEETEHMRGKVEKPESLDGVNPVTRFGIWLLIRDCSQLLDEVTMAYYDKIWCETPPMSFQTRHNPFEPVYLWQFIQCLIVTSVAYYVDIPRKRQQEVVSDHSEVEAAAVSEETMKSGTTPAEQRRAMIARHQRALLQTYVSSQFIIANKKVGHSKKARKNSNFTVVTGVEEKKHHSKKHLVPENIETATNKPEKDGRKQSNAGDTKNKPPNSPQNQEGQAKAPETQKPKSTKAKRKSKGRPSVAESEMPSEMPPKLPQIIPRVSVGNASETEEEFSSTELDLLEVEDEFLGPSSRKSVLFRNSEMMAHEELQNAPIHETTSAISVSECFEMFLTDKLLPCLRREPGANLPPVPQPLPALVDLYDAFKAIKTRDVLRGTEFLRSALPHLLFPNPVDTIWWHRSPEALSHSVDLDDLIYLLREKFPDATDEPHDEVNWEEQLESEYLGAQAQNSETVIRILNLCKEDPNSEECAAAKAEGSNVKRMSIALPKNILTELKKEDKGNDGDDEDPASNDLSDFAAEGHPFAENELVPEPFLWADDYKCVPVPRNYQHFQNINTTDVFEVLHQLYPRLCSGAHERDLHFDLIFCDWLWCTSLLAKVSTEREFRNAWKAKPTETKPIMNPQTLGVYAHYIKQIKNNPYLSPNPPPNFTPRRKAPEVDTRGSVYKSTSSFKKLKQ